jgi:hypothetical protein
MLLRVVSMRVSPPTALRERKRKNKIKPRKSSSFLNFFWGVNGMELIQCDPYKGFMWGKKNSANVARFSLF